MFYDPEFPAFQGEILLEFYLVQREMFKKMLVRSVCAAQCLSLSNCISPGKLETTEPTDHDHGTFVRSKGVNSIYAFVLYFSQDNK